MAEVGFMNEAQCHRARKKKWAAEEALRPFIPNDGTCIHAKKN